ncbi:hypothetical protein J1N35_018573 [Gossypium stocksii]|uniref:DUF4283 domain-containing protein n=1 Tax=Gossypium stocksii TaxID=47602 RepID=A0A9D4A7C7_9ROSI|nr:hypothetical protein J1N35_018573 [Gossypium stocksii]
MAEVKPNREEMYRVFQLLWFTKEEINFVALKEEVIIVKFGCLEDRSRILSLMPWLFDNCLFSLLPFIKGKEIDSYEFNQYFFWLRIYNVTLEYMNHQTTMEVGKAIGELVAIDWKDRDGSLTEFIRGTRRNGVETVTTNILLNEDREDSKTDTRDDSGQQTQKGKEKGGKEESISTSPLEKRHHKSMRDGMGLFRSKRKRQRGPNGENTNESPSKIARRRFMDNVSPFKAVVGDQPYCPLNLWKHRGILR